MSRSVRGALVGAAVGATTTTVGTVVVMSRGELLLALVLGSATGLLVGGAVLLSYSLLTQDGTESGS